MSKVRTNDQYYADIANAIRTRNGLSTLYKPRELADAIYTVFDLDENVSTIIFNTPVDTSITVTVDEEDHILTADSNGVATLAECEPGTYTAELVYGGVTLTRSLNILKDTQRHTYTVNLSTSDFGHIVKVDTMSGARTTITGTTTEGLVVNMSDLQHYERSPYTYTYTFEGISPGTYTITAEGYDITKTASLTIPESLTPTTYTVDLTYTLPDLTIWLLVSKDYTTTACTVRLHGTTTTTYTATKTTNSEHPNDYIWQVSNIPRFGYSLEFDVTINGTTYTRSLTGAIPAYSGRRIVAERIDYMVWPI